MTFLESGNSVWSKQRVLYLSSIRNDDSLYWHGPRYDKWAHFPHPGTHAWSDLRVLVFYLCLETCIRNKQCSAAVWDPALTPCCRMNVLVMHHPRRHTAHGGVHQRASSPAHRLSAFMLSASLTAYVEKGSSLSSCGDEAQCGRYGV